MLACWMASQGLSGARAANEAGPATAADVLLPAPTPLTATQTVYLDVTLNQSPRGLLPFTDVAGRLQAPAGTLRQLGFPVQGDAPAFLDQIAGAVVRYDTALQTLALDVPLERLALPTTRVGATADAAPRASASPGATLGYDLYASHTDGRDSLSLTSQLQVFGIGAGSLATSTLMRTYQQADRGWRHDAVRLDSRWALDLPERALTLTVGDIYSGFLDWSRPVRLGGIQIGRNYGLQPYRVLTPTPAFLGEAVVPSSVELYVDGLRQYSGELPVGPFQLAAQPGISGTGTAQVVITDAYGQMRTLDFSFYGTQQLLADGLSDWSFGVGQLREDYGVRSFGYDPRTVASATWRYGLDDRFTIESHAEGGGGVRNAGAGGLWLLGRAGVLSAAYAASRMDGLSGRQTSLGYSWNNRRFNFNLLSRRTHGEYRDLGALQDSQAPSVSEQATAGINLGRAGSLSASYLRLDYPEQPRSRYASLFWSGSVARRWSAYASFNQDLDDASERSVYLSLSVDLGDSRQASVAGQRNGDTQLFTADVMKPVPGDGNGDGYGWRVQARDGDNGAGGLAEIGKLGRNGRYSLGVSSQGGTTDAYASASGSLVWMGGHVFAAREIPDAFALVSTGYPGVPVQLENRELGRTDDHGLLLVTPLLSWQRNRVSIDTMALPGDVRADRVEAIATPRQGAGVLVDFALRQVRGVIVVVHAADGTAPAAGTRVLRDGHPDGVVGYDGQVYIEDVDAVTMLVLVGEHGRCQVQVPPPPPGARRIGPLACVAEPAP